MKHKSLLILVLALLLVVPALAWISSTASVDYLNHTIARVDGNTSINITFSGTANITIAYNNTDNATGVARTLNLSTNTASPYRFQWNTSNGSFSDGRYNLTIIITNASNFSDNVTFYAHNITIDNTAPLAQNITARPAVLVNGVNYTNATPVFSVNLSDPTSGIASCEFARNQTDGFVQVTHDNTTLCVRELSGVAHGTVLNVTFRATDKAGNTGANATRMSYAVDDLPPFAIIEALSRTVYRDGEAIALNVTVFDFGANVTNRTLCNVTIDGSITGFTGVLNYSNLTNACTGTITLGNPSGIADGDHSLAVSVRDAVGNSNTSSTTITIDNGLPVIAAVAFSKRNAQNTTDPITIGVNVSDTNGVANVSIANGTARLFFTLVTGTVFAGNWTLTLNLSDLNCVDERVCALNLSVNDTVGNTNSTFSTSIVASDRLLFIDSLPPRIVFNGTNTSVAAVNQHVLFEANWSDVALLSNIGLRVVLEIFNHTAGVFEYQNSTTAYYGTLGANITNYTVAVAGAYEGKALIGRISLNDTYNRTNTTQNLTVIIANSSPNITVSTANHTYISNNETLVLTMGDFGSGINISSLAVNVTGAANYSFTYATNSTLFNCSCTTCSSSSVNSTDIRMCSVRTDWPIGNISLAFTLADNAGNNASAAYRYFSTNDRPDIVNLTINGVLIAETTTSDLAISITNSSEQAVFNWSVLSNFTINSTAISLYNNTAAHVVSLSTLPASTTFVLVAGKNVMRINASVNPTQFADVLYLNITANIPLNLTHYRVLYSNGIIADFNVTSGTDITSTTDYINKTIDIILTIRNTTAQVPYSGTINYSSLDGLSLRWNQSDDAFSIGPMTHSSDENITISLANLGSTGEFLDHQDVLVAATLNITSVNRTFFFNDRLVLACDAVPASPIGIDETCYVSTASSTTIYLPYFRQGDELRAVEPPSSAPVITDGFEDEYNQSTVPVTIAAYSAFANTTYCSYDLSRFNTTTNLSVTYSAQAVLLSQFSLDDDTWTYSENVSGLPDGPYNLTISCADSFGVRSNSTFRFNITDVIAPRISDVSATSVGRSVATISGSADENVTFTVHYGTASTALSSSASDSAFSRQISIELEDLDEDTLYYYNLTGCDAKNQCNTSTTGTFRTLEPSESSPGGGGGGGAATDLPGAVESTDSRVWGRIEAGQTIAYSTKTIAFSEIEIHFANETPSAKITVKQHKNKLPQLPSPPSTVYKYLTVDHVGLAAADKFIVTVKVPVSWLKENGMGQDDVGLYRLEEDRWVVYRMLKTGNTGIDIVYTAPVPGFSHFAIGRVSAPLTAPDVVDEPLVPAEIPQEPAIPQDETPASFVSAKEKTDLEIPSWFYVLLAIIAISGGSAIGLRQYALYQEKESKHVEQVRIEGERKRAMQAAQQAAQRSADHDPMRQLFDYIQVQRAKGVPEDAIREKLVSAGWDELVVHMELMRR